MKGLNDIDLIKKGLKRDKLAIEVLYSRHKSYWFRICLRYGRNRSEAEDIFQDGVSKIFQELKKFNPAKGTFKAWSNRVLINEIIKSLKKNHWEDSFSVIHNNESSINLNCDIIERITTKELTEIVQSLPIGYRTVFNMHAIEGYTHKEISYILSISIGTSKSQLSRAKKILQEHIKLLF